MTAFEERPHSPYYGSVDATPLYVVLLDEYERWTGDTKLVRTLEHQARAALAWIDDYADLQGNGYVAYQRRNEQTGLENQCWKDSWDSISYRDGRLPGFPRATCELQGYAYDAKVRGARPGARGLARPRPSPSGSRRRRPTSSAASTATSGSRTASTTRSPWTADGSKVDALTSNIGHLLWSGIVDKAKAKAVARHLMWPAMYSGWGVRTMAEGEARYNPIGYHVGTVWPFDNSFIAWGLRALRLQGGGGARSPPGSSTRRRVLRRPAAGGVRRLPARADQVPGRSTRPPAARRPGRRAPRCCCCARCSGSSRPGDNLIVDPALPRGIGRLELLDIPGRWGRMDAFGRGRVDVDKRPRARSQLGVVPPEKSKRRGGRRGSAPHA